MIIVKLNGGLGNQMFQYSFGKALSVEYMEPLFLDLSWYKRKNSKRKFLLGEMKTSFDSSTKSPLFMKIIRLIKKPAVLKDKGFFEEENLNCGKNTILEGFWESQKYFSEITDLIKRGFELKAPSEKFKELAGKINKNSISVHIRRGDYLKPHGKSLNGFDYCNRAVEYILKNKKMDNPKITVFSDDPEWCRKEMKVLAGQPTEIFEEKLNSDAEELILMSLYGNNVISNSTFSWWAAFLNKNTDKIVVMPENWFTDKETNAKYLSGIQNPDWVILK